MTLPYVLYLETQGQVLSNMPSGITPSEDEWQSLSVKTPDAAMDIILQRSISVIVANFGADLDGCKQFLKKVRTQASPSIQFVLLVESIEDKLDEHEEYVSLCISAHSEPIEIINEIQRGLSIWQQVKDKDSLARLLIKLNKLPTPPALYFDLRDELESDSCCVETVANIISRDQAITVKLLKVVNSGFYGVPRSIIELKQAISLLGMELVLGLVLMAYLFDSLPLPGFDLDKQWKHNLMISALAKHIAVELGGDREIINASGIAGLLHDLGILVFLANLPAQYHPIIRQAAGDESVLLKLENECFGATHPEIGALALRLCNLPDSIIEAVSLHHQQPGQMDSLPAKALSLAEWLVNAYSVHGSDFSESVDCSALTDDMLEHVEGWWQKCTQVAAKI